MAGASRTRGKEAVCGCRREGLGAEDAPGLPYPSLGAQTCPTAICIVLSVNMVVFLKAVLNSFWYIFFLSYAALHSVFMDFPPPPVFLLQ